MQEGSGAHSDSYPVSTVRFVPVVMRLGLSLHGVVLYYLSTGRTLPFTFIMSAYRIPACGAETCLVVQEKFGPYGILSFTTMATRVRHISVLNRLNPDHVLNV
jgi:hypothetical protein